MDRRPRARSTHLAAAGVLLGASAWLLGGCAADAELAQDVHDVGIADFSRPIQGPVPEVVATPLPDVEPPSVTQVDNVTELGDGTKIEKKAVEITAVDQIGKSVV